MTTDHGSLAISKRIVRSGPDKFGDRLAAARCCLGQFPGELRQLGVALDAAELPRGGKHAGRCPAQPDVPVLPALHLSLIHISEPTRLLSISYAVFCLKKKKQ